jgi:serine/threonine protein kinase
MTQNRTSGSKDKLPPVSADTTGKTAPKPKPAPLPKRIGSYRVQAFLGEGGMGVVYKAAQDNPPRQVALKVLPPGSTSPSRLSRFEHEAKILAKLQHPGIAQIFEAGVADDGHGPQPFFAMELIKGSNLREYVEDQDQPLALRDKLQLFTRVCQAVEYAHRQGIIHRDLKPENILVDELGQPKVIDFGVARVTDAELRLTSQGTAVGQLVGTFRYMSPEQIKADPDELDWRSDVYTLGVICHELLTGQLPYEELQHKEMKRPLPVIARIITESEPTPLSSFDKVFRGDLDTIVAKALEKDKTQRYQSAAELAEEVERYLNDEPIQARPANALYRLRKFSKRNKALVGGILGILLALILGTIGTTGWAIVAIAATRAEKEAQDRLANALEVKVQQAVQLAMQRGAWAEALDIIDKALATEHHQDSIPLRLKRARVLLALTRTGEAGKEIEALLKRNNLGEHEGSIRLTQADIFLGKDVAKTIERIREAQAKGLPPAEESYAKALVAETTPEAVDRLRESLAIDRYQPRAHAMLTNLLLFLGRRDEFKTEVTMWVAMYPEDINAKLMQALGEALDNKLQEANTIIDGLRGQLDEQDYNDSKATVALLAYYSDAKNWQNINALPDMKDPERVLRTIGKRWGINIKKLDAEIDVVDHLPLPPLVLKTYGELAKALDLLAKGEKDDKVVEQLNKALAVHPEGTIRHILTGMHFAAGRFIEAEREGLATAEMNSLFPVQRPSLFMAATAEAFMGTPMRPDPDLKKRAKALKTLRRVIALNPIAMNPDAHNEREIAVKIALYADDLALARQILDEWERQLPKELKAKMLRARVELKGGAYGKAIEAAREVLKNNPKDAEMLQVEQEAMKKLREQARLLAP